MIILACEGSLISQHFFASKRIYLMLFSARVISTRAEVVIWLILPVVICLSQRLSHACVSVSIIQRNCEWLITSVIIYMIFESYMDNRDKLQLIHASIPDFIEG